MSGLRHCSIYRPIRRCHPAHALRTPRARREAPRVDRLPFGPLTGVDVDVVLGAGVGEAEVDAALAALVALNGAARVLVVDTVVISIAGFTKACTARGTRRQPFDFAPMGGQFDVASSSARTEGHTGVHRTCR